MVMPLLPVQTDFFFALGKAPLEYRPAMRKGWLASFAAFRVVGGSLQSEGDQRKKLDACFAQIRLAEVSSGHNYTHIFRLRTDMLFLRPVSLSTSTTLWACVRVLRCLTRGRVMCQILRTTHACPADLRLTRTRAAPFRSPLSA